MNKSFVAILFFLAIAFGCKSSVNKKVAVFSSPDKAIVSIDSLLLRADYQAALTICNAQITSGNNTPNFIFRKAFCLANMEQDNLAIPELTYLIENVSDTLNEESIFAGRIYYKIQSLFLRSILLSGMGKYREAYLDMEKVYIEDSNNVDAVVYLAKLSNDIGLKEQTIYLENKAYTLDSTNPAAIANVGFRYLREKEPLIAIHYFDRAIQYDSTAYSTYFHRARAYKLLGNFELASSDFKKSIELNPNNAEIYFHYGELYLMQGEKGKTKACELFHKAESLGFDFKSMTIDSGSKSYDFIYQKLCR